MVVPFAVHPRTSLTTSVPNDLIIEIPDFDADRQAVIRVRVHNGNRKEIVLKRYRCSMLRTSVQIRNLVRVSIRLDLVLVQQRHYASGVVEDRRPFATVREVNRILLVDGQSYLAHRHHNQVFVITVRN